MYNVDESDYDELRTIISDIIIAHSKSMKPQVLASEILSKMDDVIIHGNIQ